jgi:hypothetical protein
MTKYVIGLAIGAALVLALSAVGVAADKAKDKAKDEADEDTLAARKDVLDVLKDVEGGKEDKVLVAKAAAIKKKDVELNNLMKVYRMKEKGGIGYGEKPDAKSGLEVKIIALQRTERGPSAATLKKEGTALIKLAHVNIAMAEIGRPHYDNFKDTGKGNNKTKKDWDKWFDEQKAAAKELIEAVKKEDSKGVAKAAKDLLNTCTECHAAFRKN